MGTTPSYGLPYPDPTGRARNGSVDIKALAEQTAAMLAAIEAKHVPAYAVTDPAASPTQSGVTGLVAATLGGYSDSGAEFDTDGVTITYAGPSRWFLVEFTCEASSAGAVSSTTRSYLHQNGVVIGRGRLTTQVGGGGTAAHQSELRIVAPLLLGPGNTLHGAVEATAPGAIFANKAIRVASMGPRL